MRDTLKSRDYFEKKFDSENRRIDKFKDALIKLNATNEKGIRIGKIHLASLFLNCVKISYSMGASCEIMFEYYLEYLKYYKDVCSADDSMYDMIDILSLGVLFKNKRDMFVSDLRETVSKFESSDGMLECFMNYIDDIPFQKKLSRIEYFNQLVSEDNKEKVLLNQLEVWYQEHTEAYWYNAHNAKNNTYCGYWCFEVAALSRVFNVDDCQLKKSPYYPYDLAHYTINQ